MIRVESTARTDRTARRLERVGGKRDKITSPTLEACGTHRYVVRRLRLLGIDDSPNSEQSTMTKIPSSSHWHGDGHDAAAAGPCLSWIHPYPHTPGADPQTPPATHKNTSTSSMSGCPPVFNFNPCRDVRLVAL